MFLHVRVAFTSEVVAYGCRCPSVLPVIVICVVQCG